MPSDHFPICFEFNKHVVDMYKTLLDRVPLKFNSLLYYFMPICNKFLTCFQNMLIQKDDMHGIQHYKTSVIFTVCMIRLMLKDISN